MKQVFSLLILMVMMMFAIVSFSSCVTDGEDPIDPNNPDDPVEVVMQDIALSGTVKDANGNPLGGVRVTQGSLSVTTGDNGTFSFTRAGTVNDRIVLQFEKSGYFKLTRSAARDDEVSDLYIETKLYPTGNSNISLQTTFDAATTKTLQIGNLKIDFPASSVVRTDGTAYSGNVRADVLYITPDNENLWQMMPGGDLTCRTSVGSEEMLLPYGIADVTLTDNEGNPLNVKKGGGVEITFPIPSGMTTSAPASLPLWTFNDARGLWLEDVTLTKQGNTYKGAVNHFSPNAVGRSTKMITVRVRVFVCEKPKEGVQVHVDNSDIDDILSLAPPPTILTNSTGVCSIRIPAKVAVRVNVIYNDQYQYQIIPVSDVLNSGALHELKFNFDDDCYGNHIKAYGKIFPLRAGQVKITDLTYYYTSCNGNGATAFYQLALHDNLYPALGLYTTAFFFNANGDWQEGMTSGTYTKEDNHDIGCIYPPLTYGDCGYQLDRSILDESKHKTGGLKISSVEVKVSEGNYSIKVTGTTIPDDSYPPSDFQLIWNGPVTVIQVKPEA